MKKTLSAIIVATLLCLMPLVAQAIGVIRFDLPANKLTDVGQLAPVAIEWGVQSPDSLGAFDLKVNFNPMIVALKDVDFGDQLASPGTDPSRPVFGSIRGFSVDPNLTDPMKSMANLFEVSLAPTDFLNSMQQEGGTLATLFFEGLNVGVSPLTFSDIVFSDADGNSIPVIIQPPNKTIEVVRVPAPSTLPLLLLGSGVLVGMIRRRGVA